MTATLVRTWTEEWLGRHDEAVAREILDPGYTLHIGGLDLGGRDAYLAATRSGLFEPFPGVRPVVHELLVCGNHTAVHLTLCDDAVAWPVVAVFAATDGKLAEGWAEEDYLARRRQQASGGRDRIPAAGPGSYEVPDPAPAPGATATVAGWLGAGAVPHLLAGATAELDVLVAAGTRVAFHGTWRGPYAGGLDRVGPEMLGASAALPFAGLATAAPAGDVRDPVLISDLLGLQRSLRRR